MRHEFAQVNGIKMHYVTEGEGPLVILLHGFPEFWYAWRRQIPALAKHYRVVVPDLRGYGDTEKPPKVTDYFIETLTTDIVELIHALGEEKAHIVGHDWGGVIAWKLALTHPHVIDHLAVLNCPHPRIFAQALHSNSEQRKKSWYILFFQIPYLPELIFKMNPRGVAEKLFRGSAVSKNTFSDEDIEVYVNQMKKPGALTAALNYYRAAFRKKRNAPHEEKPIKIAIPTLLIWAENDVAFGNELTQGMDELMTGPFKVEYIPNCSHWVNEERPEIVNQLLIDFL